MDHESLRNIITNDDGEDFPIKKNFTKDVKNLYDRPKESNRS